MVGRQFLEVVVVAMDSKAIPEELAFTVEQVEAA
jgi:hypothetical protein